MNGEVYQWVHQPGNGTRYWIIAGTDTAGTPFACLPDFGAAATMRWDAFTTASYVEDKLGRFLTEHDCEVIADFFTEQARKRSAA